MSEALIEKGNRIVCDSDEVNRHTAFLNEYTTGKDAWNIYRSAIAVGYKKSTASKQGKRILSTALRNERKRLEENGETLSGKIGLSREEVMEELRFIIMQRNDLRTKIKALETFVRSEGIDLSPPKSSHTTFNSPVMIQITPPKENIRPHKEGKLIHENKYKVSQLDEMVRNAPTNNPVKGSNKNQ